MTTVLNGVLGGLLVGLVAGLVTQLIDGDPSATAVALKRAVGTRAASSRLVELVTQMGYGCLAGGILLALELYVLGLLAVPPAISEALAVAVVWSALLLGTVLAVWRIAASLSSTQLRELFVYHLVYGLGLGLWIRLTWIT